MEMAILLLVVLQSTHVHKRLSSPVVTEMTGTPSSMVATLLSGRSWRNWCKTSKLTTMPTIPSITTSKTSMYSNLTTHTLSRMCLISEVDSRTAELRLSISTVMYSALESAWLLTTKAVLFAVDAPAQPSPSAHVAKNTDPLQCRIN